MKWIWSKLHFLLPVAVLGGALLYSLVIRELPKAEGRITGDFAAASALAREQGIPLLLAVSPPPH
ncbi:MAG: hypothetical protein IT463_06435 [Planctomycetes bacterium]|nr:hypothetical protein [Planctomycetota bacterium]